MPNNNEEDEFVSSIGLKSGERNLKAQSETGNSWKDVDWFLHTWGFLPNDTNVISKLTDNQKNNIILLALDFIWRRNPSFGMHKDVIGFLQDDIGDPINYFKEKETQH